MDRAGWKVLLVLGLLGVAGGFGKSERPATCVPAPPQPRADDEELEAQVRQYVNELVNYFRNPRRAVARQKLPPLDELPPLPEDFLPPGAISAEALTAERDAME
jgi:hypothetical protein